MKSASQILQSWPFSTSKSGKRIPTPLTEALLRGGDQINIEQTCICPLAQQANIISKCVFYTQQSHDTSGKYLDLRCTILRLNPEVVYLRACYLNGTMTFTIDSSWATILTLTLILLRMYAYFVSASPFEEDNDV